jgi:hypothetical protein
MHAYAEAINGEWWTGGRDYVERAVRAVISLADVEQDELRAEVKRLLGVIRKARSFHGNSIDPDECMECENSHMPCRSAELLDAALAAAPAEKPSLHERAKAMGISGQGEDIDILTGKRMTAEEAERCNAPRHEMRCVRPLGHASQHGYAGIYWDPEQAEGEATR